MTFRAKSDRHLTGHLLIAIGVLTAAACAVEVTPTEKLDSASQSIGNTPATDSTCIDACAAADGCGLLVQFGISSDQCVDICKSNYTNEDAQWAQSATCDDLEQAIQDGGAPELSPCTEACDKVDACGILANVGMSLNQCFDVCLDSYTDDQVAWALTATCDQLEAVLIADSPITPCTELCDKVEGCGLLQQYNTSFSQCLGQCASYSDSEVDMALNLSCSELEAIIANL